MIKTNNQIIYIGTASGHKTIRPNCWCFNFLCVIFFLIRLVGSSLFSISLHHSHVCHLKPPTDKHAHIQRTMWSTTFNANITPGLTNLVCKCNKVHFVSCAASYFQIICDDLVCLADAYVNFEKQANYLFLTYDSCTDSRSNPFDPFE